MKHALVTGGCGFLGSVVVRDLVERGVQVRCLALPAEPTVAIDDLGDAVEVVRGDVRSVEDCRRVVEGVDTVFHIAAIYDDHAPDPSRMYDVNLRGTFNVLEASRRAGVEQVVYTASVVALGRPPAGTTGDEDTSYDAWDLDFPYSRSKYHSRVLAEDFAAWDLDVRIVCPGIVFGPGDRRPTPSGKLIVELLRGGPPAVMDGGGSYVDVRDAARVHVLAAERGRAGRRYVASAHNLSNRDLVEALDRVAGLGRRYFRVPVPIARMAVTAVNEVAALRGRPPRLARDFFEYSLVPSFFDNSRSRRELGAEYRPLDETLRDAIDFFRREGMV